MFPSPQHISDSMHLIGFNVSLQQSTCFLCDSAIHRFCSCFGGSLFVEANGSCIDPVLFFGGYCICVCVVMFVMRNNVRLDVTAC